MVKSPAQRLDISIWHHVPRPMDHEQSLDLSLINLALIFGIHGLEQFCNLKISLSEVRANNSGVELLNLPLDLPLDLYLTLQEFGEGAHDIIATLLNVANFFPFDL